MGGQSRLASVTTSILLFIIVLALWQIYDFVILQFAPPLLITHLIFLGMPLISLAMFALLVRLMDSSFKKHGYKKPVAIRSINSVLLSGLFIVIYVFITLAQGLFGTFGTADFPIDPYNLIFRLALAVLFSLASESIFRGYILRNLVGKYGFFSALYASSILFSLHDISIRSLLEMNAQNIIMFIFTSIIPALAAGIFLGFYSYKTGWSLLGPVTFRIFWLFLLEPLPIISASSPWWIALTFEMMAFVILIFTIESIIKEPMTRRRRYGLEG